MVFTENDLTNAVRPAPVYARPSILVERGVGTPSSERLPPVAGTRVRRQLVGSGRGLDVHPGQLEMLVFQLPANGDPQSLRSVPELFASTAPESAVTVPAGLSEEVIAVLEKLSDAAAMFAGRPAAIDPEDIADLERGVRDLKPIVLTSR